MSTTESIHPFPARMAPEVALAQCDSLPANSVVLDPMCGSGTVIRAASERQHRALGYDLDPLAILMARVNTTPIDPDALRATAALVRDQAEALDRASIQLPWIDDKTEQYIEYWFAEPQRSALRCLSSVLLQQEGPVGDALRLALSRIIITKERGASLARDVPHSRPHRVRLENDFPVFTEFVRSANRLAKRLQDAPPPGGARVSQGDARHLRTTDPATVDAVITSPPYLNAIDYIRGHRLSLVWLGYSLADLRAIRSSSTGTERQADPSADVAVADELLTDLHPARQLPAREWGMLRRYALDILATLQEAMRVLRPGGRAVLVVGNSCLRGAFVENALAVIAAAKRVGLRLTDRQERELPPNRRYLPPPSTGQASSLEKRMRTESVLSFTKPGIVCTTPAP